MSDQFLYKRREFIALLGGELRASARRGLKPVRQKRIRA
jgi:hypothetical protein